MANKFEGWTVISSDSVKGNLKWDEYTVKDFQEDDVELKILYSGICSSDLHTMSNGWGDVSSLYPIVVGHEIIGEVIKAGPKTEFKEGQIVGIGPMCDSCLECEYCEKGENNFCGKGVGTYAGKFQRGPSAGQQPQGGYALKWRGPATFVTPIPEGLDLAATAPLLCAGVTVFFPLEKYGAGTKAKKVGVVGLGGLGHIAVQFAAAMGAEVTVISHSDRKNEDAKKMGASNVIVTGEDPAKACAEHTRTLDLIICTSFDDKLPLDAYISLLKPGGTFSCVGVSGNSVKLNPWQFILNGVHFTSSPCHSPAGARRTLEFAAKHGIKPWVTKYPLDKVIEAVVSMDKGESRYRHVLVVEQNGAKL